MTNTCLGLPTNGHPLSARLGSPHSARSIQWKTLRGVFSALQELSICLRPRCPWGPQVAPSPFIPSSDTINQTRIPLVTREQEATWQEVKRCTSGSEGKGASNLKGYPKAIRPGQLAKGHKGWRGTAHSRPPSPGAFLPLFFPALHPAPLNSVRTLVASGRQGQSPGAVPVPHGGDLQNLWGALHKWEELLSCRRLPLPTHPSAPCVPQSHAAQVTSDFLQESTPVSRDPSPSPSPNPRESAGATGRKRRRKRLLALAGTGARNSC